MQQDPHLFSLDTDIPLPEKFTYPFYYYPHPISELAAEKLMQFLEKEAPKYGWEFGLTDKETAPRGRMFGVLVVQIADGSLGYLSAYSGNISLKDKGYPFVPPVFDFWDEDGFYLNGVREFEQLTEKIKVMESDDEYNTLKVQYKYETENFAKEIKLSHEVLKQSKEKRDKIRIAAENLSAEKFSELDARLIKESTDQNFEHKRLKKKWKLKLEELFTSIQSYEAEIDKLKNKRKLLSNELQEAIYDGFQFLNRFGETQGLSEIFKQTALKQPPSGAGECAAPRLLQHAFKMGYNPVCIAEFWWGASSKDEMRVHKHYYPACRGKCKPILGHMLKGLDLEDNPLIINALNSKEPRIVYEDDYLVLISKPEGLLSVPGREIQDSVLSIMQSKYPMATGPLIVHRLDMDTSGLMLIAKNLNTYKALQSQFIRRKIKKRYVALLEGIVTEDSGLITLPLIGDYINRPRQMVSFEEGKKALTHYEVISRKEGRTLINFFPHTGRTHQLRVHSAHCLGLNCPIVGDDLYGSKDIRLFLHAAEIGFEHPISREWMQFILEPEF